MLSSCHSSINVFFTLLVFVFLEKHVTVNDIIVISICVNIIQILLVFKPILFEITLLIRSETISSRLGLRSLPHASIDKIKKVRKPRFQNSGKKG